MALILFGGAFMNIKNSKGFSLIELLVVLAVLAIAAIIAIPAYGNIRNETYMSGRRDAARIIANAVNFEITAANTNKTNKKKILDAFGQGNGLVTIKKPNETQPWDNSANNMELAQLLLKKEALDEKIYNGFYKIVLNKDSSGTVYVMEVCFTEDKNNTEGKRLLNWSGYSPCQ